MFDLPPSTTDHPYRSAPAPRTLDPDGSRVPYDGQTRMRLTISSGLVDARVVIDPAARDLLSVACGDGAAPRIRLVGDELALSWRLSFGDWLREVFAPGFDTATIVLHPAVDWTFAVRGGLSGVELDLVGGKVARIDIAGGCSHVALDLPSALAVVPIRVAGGASHLGLRRPAGTGVGLDVTGGISNLRLDDQSFGAIGGGAHLDTDDVTRSAPHYDLTIAGGASDLVVMRR
ncbi:MAG TPA: hypothetical protein VM261_33355 [Kofleriaceae bacterium]|nr:hypothetical protein [Kofleriaceae bacterium]